MFFQKRSKNQFLDVKGADRWSKVRFWSHFGTKGGTQNDPWKPTFRPKGLPGVTRQDEGSRPFADPAPHDPPKPPNFAFLSILVGFWTHFHRCWSLFRSMLGVFSMDFPSPHKRQTIKRTPPNSKVFLRPGGMRA